MKSLLKLTLILFFIVFYSCKKDKPKTVKSAEIVVKIKEKEKSHPIEISLVNIKSRDSVSYKGLRFRTQKTILSTTFLDSIQSDKIIILNKEPGNKNFTYQVSEKEVINLNINTTLEDYNFFLKANDKLEIEFDENGFISKSSINGNEKDVSLLFSKNRIPSKNIEYLKVIKKHGLYRFDDSSFEKSFEERFQKEIKLVMDSLQKSKSDLDSNIYESLENHLKFTTIQNEYSKGNAVGISLSDSYMNLASYRELSNYMLNGEYDVACLDVDKEGIKKIFSIMKKLGDIDFLKDKEKTKYLLIRDLLSITGEQKPNLIPELIAKIKDVDMRKKYLKIYSDEYLLELKDKRNDSVHLNMINISKPNEIITFDEFLAKNIGKVVYVDLWASWCSSCRKQMRSSHVLSKKLAGKPIVFAYFSIDKSFVKWNFASIEEEVETNPNSYLFLNTKNSKKYNSWKVRGVPRYLIYDKKGKLVDEKGPFPNDKNTLKLLLKYTAEN